MNSLTHLAIIMDGNGRWALNHGLTRDKGHFYGAQRVAPVAKHLFARGVKVVSLYAFSTENFKRPTDEINGIFERIKEFIAALPTLFDGSVRVIFSGERDGIGEDLQRTIVFAEDSTRLNAPYTLNILLNYGGRAEILRAARLLSGREITEESFKRALYADLPDPDMIIRTGGEKRLSGFMLYQAAYSELYFTDVLFPDLSEADLDEAIKEYYSRDRRYGGI